MKIFADGSLVVFGLDTAGDLWMAAEAAPGVAWSQWKMLPRIPGGVQRGFAAAENLTGRIDIFALDCSAHPSLWRIGQTRDNGWDQRWSRLGAPHGRILQPGLQTGRTLTGRVAVFALDRTCVGRGGSLWSIAQNSQAGEWGDWSALPVLRGASLLPGFVNMQNSDGRFELVAAGSNGEVYRLAQGLDAPWAKTWSILSGADGPNLAHSTFVTGNTNDGRLQIFATDQNGMMYSHWQQAPGRDWKSGWSAPGSRQGLAFNR